MDKKYEEIERGKTPRGYQYINFKDTCNFKCTIDTSDKPYDRRGEFLALGIIYNPMYLNRETVKKLIIFLEKFLKDGDIF